MAAYGTGRAATTDAGRLAALLATFDSSTPSLTLFRVAAGVRLVGPPVDGVAAFLVLSGTMALDVEGEARRVVDAGHLALVSAGQVAHLSPDGAPATTTLDGRQTLTPRDGWLVADAAQRREPALVVAAGRIAGSGALGPTDSVVAPVTACPIGRPIFALLRAECDRGAAGSPALAAALMNACVVQGLRRAIEAAPERMPDTRADRAHRGLIARAVAAIRTRPAEAHTVDTLASVAGMSRSTFVRHFKRALRIAPGEYLQQVRLEEARTMLESTDLPVKTIATRTGFASRSHFSRLFRSTFGDDPSSHRERLRSET